MSILLPALVLVAVSAEPDGAGALVGETEVVEEMVHADLTPDVDADAACRAETADLMRALGTAEAYFASLNADGFRRASDEAADLVPCMQEAVPTSLVAELHRVQGIRAFLDRDEDAALWFAAARALEPDYAFPEYLVPAGHPLLATYSARQDASPVHTLHLPREGHLRIDGRHTLDRPVEVPAVVQHFDDRGRVLTTALLLPGDPVFSYKPAPRQLLNPRYARWSVGFLAVAGLTFLGAHSQAHAYWAEVEDPSQKLTHTELAAQRTTVNGLVYTSAFLATVGVGLGTAAVLTAEGER